MTCHDIFFVSLYCLVKVKQSNRKLDSCCIFVNIINELMEKVQININKKFGQYKEVTQSEFWQYYLRLININSPFLTEQEIILLSLILAEDLNRSCLIGETRKELERRMRISKGRMSQLKTSLLQKGYLEETGVVMGDVLLHKNFRVFKKVMMQKLADDPNFVVQFTVPLKIVEHDNSRIDTEAGFKVFSPDTQYTREDSVVS